MEKATADASTSPFTTSVQVKFTPPTMSACADILTLRKSSVNRRFESQGFPAAILNGAETDALLHFADPVRRLMLSIRDDRLS